VGQIASHARYKGFDEVIDAMPELPRRFPNLKYTIVGDGACPGSAPDRISGLKMEGFLAHRNHQRVEM
jgi:glycosyltransferase involved in cell wall biosynthesis